MGPLDKKSDNGPHQVGFLRISRSHCFCLNLLITFRVVLSKVFVKDGCDIISVIRVDPGRLIGYDMILK